MSDFSRRSLISSTAALPALAFPAFAVSHPSDAELERLGQRIEDAWKALDEACRSRRMAKPTVAPRRQLSPNRRSVHEFSSLILSNSCLHQRYQQLIPCSSAFA